MQNKDQFGFYRVGDFKTYSKLEAIEMHTKTGVHPHWDFNEAVYSSYDWTIEPTESILELYRKRAEQLREEYDYLVLLYSSGSDCDNILHSFLDNNIRLDEVASFVNYESTGDKTSFFNNEVFNIGVPKIKSLQVDHPDLKHRLVDIEPVIIEYFSNPSAKFDWPYLMNSIINPNTTCRNRAVHSIPEYLNLIQQDKKVGFIWGVEKPRLYIENGKYCVRFIDIIDAAVPAKEQKDNAPGHYDEFFYWSPNMPTIPIKQAHIIKKYLDLATESTRFMSTNNTGLGYKFINGKQYWLTGPGINYLLYPKYEFHIENNTKPSALFWTPRDAWFFNLPYNHVAKQSWRTALKYRWNAVPDYWKNNPNNPQKAFKQCLSKPYFLE